MPIQMRTCFVCREKGKCTVIGCHLYSDKPSLFVITTDCHWCSDCFIDDFCANDETSGGLCQRHLQEAMDKLRDRRKNE